MSVTPGASTGTTDRIGSVSRTRPAWLRVDEPDLSELPQARHQRHDAQQSVPTNAAAIGITACDLVTTTPRFLFPSGPGDALPPGRQ